MFYSPPLVVSGPNIIVGHPALLAAYGKTLQVRDRLYKVRTDIIVRLQHL